MSDLTEKWTDRFIGLAKHFAEWSEDDSTRVGAVIISADKDIRSWGWNGLPRGVQSLPERFERPVKYYYFEHAERNAIYNATRNGICLKDSLMFVTHFPCPDCARAIIQSGVKEVYYCTVVSGEKWSAGHQITLQMFRESGVTVHVLDQA